MTAADFNGSQSETVIARIEKFAVPITKFCHHSIERRMVEVPQLRVRDGKLEFDCARAWNSRNGGCCGIAYDGSGGRVGGRSYLKPVLTPRKIIEEYARRDLSLVRCSRT